MVVVSAFVSAGIALILPICLQSLHPCFVDEGEDIVFVRLKPSCCHASNASALALLQCLLSARNYFTPTVVLCRPTENKEA